MLEMVENNIKIYWSDSVVNDIRPCKSTVLALGTFDGVHVAHKKLLEEAVNLKKSLGAEYAGAWCFSQSPASILRGIDIPALTTLEQKIKLMLDCGIDFVAVGDFQDFCNISADDFINKVLAHHLNCVGAVCGFDHRFGYKGIGNASLLKERLGNDNVIEVSEIKIHGETVSSTAIREKIASGQIADANEMLGRCFELQSPVVHGKKLGREMQFPTANQFFPQDLIVPKHGIYATLCTLEDGRRLIGVSNVGIRPTISDDKDSHIANCETYICYFSDDIYGQALYVSFCAYLREEKRFSSIDELSEAISKDKDNAIAYFKSYNID